MSKSTTTQKPRTGNHLRTCGFHNAAAPRNTPCPQNGRKIHCLPSPNHRPTSSASPYAPLLIHLSHSLSPKNSRSLTSTGVLAYTLGLRHALDADHISAIDLVTRRLVATGRRPATVGTFFSLGHSTIVIVTCIVVAATASAVAHRFDTFSTIGGIIGTAVSAGVLIIFGAVNAWIMVGLIRRMRVLWRQRRGLDWLGGRGGVVVGGDGGEDGGVPAAVRCPDLDESSARAAVGGDDDARVRRQAADDTRQDELQFQLQLQHQQQEQLQQQFHGPGCLTWLLRGVMRAVDRPWKMYPLGVLFGLGFDTSSEVALIGIASIEGARGTSIWLILIFPILFTAGMCLLDTVDGALMLSLYTSTSLAKDPIAICYYSLILTAVTVAAAVAIGTIQLLSLVLNVAVPDPDSSSFWSGVQAAGDHFDIVGGGICASFIVSGLLGVLLYQPWRRWMEGRGQGPDSGRIRDAAKGGSQRQNWDQKGDDALIKGKGEYSWRERSTEILPGGGGGSSGSHPGEIEMTPLTPGPSSLPPSASAAGQFKDVGPGARERLHGAP